MDMLSASRSRCARNNSSPIEPPSTTCMWKYYISCLQSEQTEASLAE